MQKTLAKILEIPDNVETRLIPVDWKIAIGFVYHHVHHHRLCGAVTWQIGFLLFSLPQQPSSLTTVIFIIVIVITFVACLE